MLLELLEQAQQAPAHAAPITAAVGEEGFFEQIFDLICSRACSPSRRREL